MDLDSRFLILTDFYSEVVGFVSGSRNLHYRLGQLYFQILLLLEFTFYMDFRFSRL